MECGVQEKVTWEEKTENRAFINAIMETEVMKECHRYGSMADIGTFET